MSPRSEESRLPTELWVTAHLARLSAEGRAAYVLRRGDRTGGLVVLKLVEAPGRALVLIQQRDLDGVLGWMSVLGPEPIAEADADAYVTRAAARDPDLWVIEIEGPVDPLPFEGKRHL